MNALIFKVRPLILFFILGLVASFLPLIGDFYLETAQVSSVLFSFLTILGVNIESFNKSSHQSPFASHLTYLSTIYFKMGVFLTPIFASALIRGCFNLDGLFFVLLIPFVAIIFVYALLIFISGLSRHYKMVTSLIIVFLVAILPLIILKIVPHVFLFNPIWGWFPGPIYDEQILLSLNLVYHSVFVLTLSLIFIIGNRSLFKLDPLKRSIIVVITGFVLLLFLYNWSNLGLGYSLKNIESHLGGVAESEHFVLIYDDEVLSDIDVNYWLFWHEFHFYELTEQLELSWSGDKIRSVLYRDVWQKHEYTGAKYTSYVPVWNSIPQLHLDLQSADLLLRHEMVHVLTKGFSNSFIGANLKIGLTEGIAVALEDPRSVRFTRDEILVNSELEIRSDLIDDAFSFLGFYGGRSSINYSVSGSFVNYLLQNYAVDDFKCVYGGSAFDECFSSFEGIKGGWVEFVNGIPPDTTATLYARNYIGRESIFEKKCSRFVSETEKQYDIYRRMYSRGDYEGAYQVLVSLNKKYPGSTTIWMNLSELGVTLNEFVPDFNFEANHNLSDSVNVFFRQADMAIVQGDFKLADHLLTRFDSISSPNPAFEAFITSQLALRGADTVTSIIDDNTILNWQHFIYIRYKHGDIRSDYPVSHHNLWLTLKSNRNERLHLNDIDLLMNMGTNELSESNLHYIIANLIQLKSTKDLDKYALELVQTLEEKAQTKQNENVLAMYYRAINFSESYH
ncbi:MAG TPA: hypothetical protein DCE78_09110 [Bacteroidetes bacterium]|nr:hypothetical protein [Bacteroidota bacterium]